MARLSTLSDSEDVKPDVSRSAQAKGKRKRGPAPGAEHDSGGYASSLSPQAAKEKKPRIKKEPGSAPAKPSAWSKAQVRQLWDALDMKPGKINWDQVSAQVDGRGKIACRDKWLKVIRPRLEAFIDSLGE